MRRNTHHVTLFDGEQFATQRNDCRRSAANITCIPLMIQIARNMNDNNNHDTHSKCILRYSGGLVGSTNSIVDYNLNNSTVQMQKKTARKCRFIYLYTTHTRLHASFVLLAQFYISFEKCVCSVSCSYAFTAWWVSSWRCLLKCRRWRQKYSKHHYGLTFSVWHRYRLAHLHSSQSSESCSMPAVCVCEWNEIKSTLIVAFAFTSRAFRSRQSVHDSRAPDSWLGSKTTSFYSFVYNFH